MKCPYCGEPNLIDAKFCAECGRPMSGELPAYMFEEEDTIMDKLNEVKENIQKAITEKNYKEILSNRENPVTNMIIVFIAWLLLRTVGIIPFIIIVRILAFMMGYFGLAFLMAVTYVYSTHQAEIRKKMEEIKGVDYRKSLKEIMDSVMPEEDENDME
ncbi:MAG: zinc ribbon domain-containing protein [Vulcanimicrobiota bacterium]